MYMLSLFSSLPPLLPLSSILPPQYKLSHSELSSRTIWLSVWDYDRFGRNQFLGELHLPLSSLDLSYLSEQWYTLMDRVRGNEIVQHAL